MQEIKLKGQKKTLNVGGQAVIEGVMMKSSNYLSIAVRKKNKKIKKKVEKYRFLSETNKILGIPFIRGIVYLIEMLVVGIKALNYSANEAGEQDEQLSSLEMAFTILLSLILVILLFIVAPFYLSKWITKDAGLLFNIIDGIIRIAIFVLYVLLISKISDIKRVFQYHGAEHKSIHTYEAGHKLTVKNVKKESTAHTRCGTSFIIIVLVISIFVFSLILSDSWYIKLLFRILLLPVIAGLSYEFLKFSSKYSQSIFMKPLIAPGLWIQKLTTREPDASQIETALAALKAVLEKEKREA